MTLSSEVLNRRLPVEGLGRPLYFFSSIGSTNDYAKELVQQNAPHGTLVIADEQTAGRGRAGRSWSTPAGTALAMSLIARPGGVPADSWACLNGVGALAVVGAVQARGGEPQIKWPNDVLIGGRKAAGVLVEAAWERDRLESAVIGVGLNVRSGSAPADDEVDFPATDLESALGADVSRTDLLVDVLRGLARWLGETGSSSLARAWEARLYGLGREVELEGQEGSTRGRLLGVTKAGRLRVELPNGETRAIGPAVRRVRLVDSGSV